jgi:hypothetical protein
MADVRERFMSFITPEPNTGCWLWTGWADADGYGKFWLNGRNVGAHRAALILFRDGIRDDELALHSCDQPGCGNPDHVRRGTQKDNIADAIRRRRRDRVRPPVLRGERNNHAKMTAPQVIALRARRAAGERLCDLAREFGITYGNAKQIAQRRTWAWLGSGMGSGIGAGDAL